MDRLVAHGCVEVMARQEDGLNSHPPVLLAPAVNSATPWNLGCPCLGPRVAGWVNVQAQASGSVGQVEWLWLSRFAVNDQDKAWVIE